MKPGWNQTSLKDSARVRLGTRLEEACRARRLKYSELARRSNVHRATIENWRSKKYRLPMSLVHLCALADELGVSLDWLLGRTGVGNPRARVEPPRPAPPKRMETPKAPAVERGSSGIGRYAEAIAMARLPRHIGRTHA
jgi:transcriptional regulator with XRE-family HTH domain